MRENFKRCAAVFLLVLLAFAPAFSQNLYKIYVNGSKISEYAYMQNGVAYIQASPIAMALGVNISWDPASRIVKIDNNVIATSPLFLDGKLYLPIESVASAIGAAVEWDGKNGAIRISQKGNSTHIADTNPTITPPSTKSPPSSGNTTVPKTPNTPVPTFTPLQIPAVNPSNTQTPAATSNSTGAPTYRTPYSSSNFNNSSSRSGSTNSGTPSSSGVSSSSSPNSGPSSSRSGDYLPKPPSSYSGQPSSSAYPTDDFRKDKLQPLGAPPSMPANLSMPPMSTLGKITSHGETFLPNSAYRPRNASNEMYRLTVTNIEYMYSIKDYYRAKPGFRFVAVYINQQNISDKVQIYTGRFSLMDKNDVSYDYIEGLSNFWMVILRPGGSNFGYLVFEIPADTNPTALVLHGLNSAPLKVALK